MNDNKVRKSNVAKIMDASGIQYRELQELAGVGPTTISRAIHDIKRCRLESLCKIARGLGVCVRDLIDESDCDD